jgi:hypothetical protein
MKSLIAVFPLVCTLAALAGCAHNHGNNYAYAPPYAPPVYPQPPGVAQPVSYAAPVANAPVVGAPGPAPAGVIVAGQTAACPQGCPDGMVVGASGIVEGGGQTPPCPPGP